MIDSHRPALLEGWRGELCGPLLLDVLEGKLACVSTEASSVDLARSELPGRSSNSSGPKLTTTKSDATIMKRIVSCFTNCYGDAGVWTAAERIGETGIDHLELALRGHNFGGLVIPESAVITEKADDQTAQAFCDHLHRHGVKISGCNVGGADIRTREGVELDRARDPVRGRAGSPSRSAFRAPASRPTPPSGGRSSTTCAGSATPPASAA